ncbi:phenazine biosynthesis-like domain-containing protein 1 isoform X1 [Mya arenaria]|uniref:phenazine biosynthesis-like domain-containing protein 1 isoform X1 n=1 Tax=Mya arenaria TaxID=6604 RepID=UPI0022E01CC3|nr:phenazine biosynthesis-like domain-containing protein 1 isoform X1 [Mya arenaria]
MAAELSIFTVDAFTAQPFTGNPAAVVLVPGSTDLPDVLQQTIASEMNLSETVYIRTLPDGGDFKTGCRFGIRWFTPTNEVPLCGHATLASAAVLFFCQGNTNPTLTFESASGPLSARRTGSGITLDFPLNPVQPFTRAANIIKLLSGASVITKSVWCPRYLVFSQEICEPSHVQDVQYSPATKKLVLRLQDNLSRDYLESLSPDTRSLQASDVSGDVKGVIVTLKGTPEAADYDFLSRYFAPWNGIPEDPVTGSAHTVLADYWRGQLGKSSFKARQCSPRGGDLGVAIVGDRVELTGSACVVMRGHLLNVT